MGDVYDQRKGKDGYLVVRYEAPANDTFFYFKDEMDEM